MIFESYAHPLGIVRYLAGDCSNREAQKKHLVIGGVVSVCGVDVRDVW